MCDTMQSRQVDRGLGFLADDSFTLRVQPEGRRCVMHPAGELDVASRHQLFAAATAGDCAEVVIDLTEVTFMDCSGYGSLVASRRAIEHAGGVLAIRGHIGQPADLIRRIATIVGEDVLSARPQRPAER